MRTFAASLLYLAAAAHLGSAGTSLRSVSRSPDEHTHRGRALQAATSPPPTPGFSVWDEKSGDCGHLSRAVDRTFPGFAAATGWTASVPCCDWPGIVCWWDRIIEVHMKPTIIRGAIEVFLNSVIALPELAILDVDGAAITDSMAGPLPGASFSLRGQVLRQLSLTNLAITGTVPSVWELLRVEAINLSDNKLEGTLPERWGKTMPSLRDLRLWGNQLMGTLPSSWGTSMQDMSWLQVSSNQLTGTLPAAWSNMTRLTLLDVAFNNLTGSLPEVWGSGGKLPRLVYLDLNQNNFTGTLPHTWGSGGGLASLRALAVPGTSLQGAIPDSYSSNAASGGKLPKLEFIIIDDSNALCGPVPDSVPLFFGNMTAATLIRGKKSLVKSCGASTPSGGPRSDTVAGR